MNAENKDLRLPDPSALREHAHVIGSVGSGKWKSLLAALGLDYEDGDGGSYFSSVSAETLANLAKFRDVRSFADLARYVEEPGSSAATDAPEPNT